MGCRMHGIRLSDGHLVGSIDLVWGFGSEIGFDLCMLSMTGKVD